MVEPLVGRSPQLGLRRDFGGSSIMSAPRPVSTSPTEVASLRPCAVTSSATLRLR